MSEILWLLMHDNPDPGTYSQSMLDRVPCVEFLSPNFPPGIDVVEKMTSPRVFKSHLPSWLLEKQILQSNCKVVWITRNPKDTYVSYFQMNKLYTAGDSTLTWDEYFTRIKNDKIHYGDWLDYQLSWAKYLDCSNFLMVKYEDLKVDITGNLKKICTFLGKPINGEMISGIMQRTTFEAMKKNIEILPTSLRFDGTISIVVRKGEIGDWKNYFSEEQNKYMDNVMKECLENSGISYNFG